MIFISKTRVVVNGKIKVNVSYAPLNGADPDAFAKKMIVTGVNLDGNSGVEQAWAKQIWELPAYVGVVAAVADGAIVDNGVGNYSPTIYGLGKITLYFRPLDGVPPDLVQAPGAEHHEILTLKFASSADNNYMGKGLNLTVTAVMHQSTDETGGRNW
jgi:hypothetical protein